MTCQHIFALGSNFEPTQQLSASSSYGGGHILVFSVSNTLIRESVHSLYRDATDTHIV